MFYRTLITPCSGCKCWKRTGTGERAGEGAGADCCSLLRPLPSARWVRWLLFTLWTFLGNLEWWGIVLNVVGDVKVILQIRIIREKVIKCRKGLVQVNSATEVEMEQRWIFNREMIFMMKVSFWFGPCSWLQLGLKILVVDLTGAESSPSKKLTDRKMFVLLSYNLKNGKYG